MIGIIERVKNNVLLSCSTLNDNIINNDLVKIIDTIIYRFAEDINSLINDSINKSETDIRNDTEGIIKKAVIKKIKRKLFIDSLALQVTNDYFIELYVNKEINLDKLKVQYIKELNKNKTSNQLNMTEDLDLTNIFDNLNDYFDKNINKYLSENNFLIKSITASISNFKKELQYSLAEMIKEVDIKYLDILVQQLEEEVDFQEENSLSEDFNENNKEIILTEEIKENKEGEKDMYNEDINYKDTKEESYNKFDKYDDMTLFNKTLLSLNTTEEKLTRKEAKLNSRREEIEEKLLATNKNIESNIQRENELSKRSLELNNKEIDINSKLSEAEVIFLNMKPLINGLNKIKSSDIQGGE